MQTVCNLLKKLFLNQKTFMKNAKLLTATAVFSVAITVAITTMSLTSAFRGQEMGQNLGNRAPQMSTEQHEAMQTALENKDYEAWLELMPENGKRAEMTETEFEAFAEKQLERMQTMETKRAEMEAKRTALSEAFAKNDYNAWLAVMQANDSNSPLLEKITTKNFAILVKAHNLRQEGETKFEEARKLMKELGVDEMGGMGMGQGKGGHSGGKGMSGMCQNQD